MGLNNLVLCRRQLIASSPKGTQGHRAPNQRSNGSVCAGTQRYPTTEIENPGVATQSILSVLHSPVLSMVPLRLNRFFVFRAPRPLLFSQPSPAESSPECVSTRFFFARMPPGLVNLSFVGTAPAQNDPPSL
jgi:hypothetical protein